MKNPIQILKRPLLALLLLAIAAGSLTGCIWARDDGGGRGHGDFHDHDRGEHHEEHHEEHH